MDWGDRRTIKIKVAMPTPTTAAPRQPFTLWTFLAIAICDVRRVVRGDDKDGIAFDLVYVESLRLIWHN